MEKYRTALILGAGISGLGAARLLTSEGVAVTVADQRPDHALVAADRRVDELGAAGHWGNPVLPDASYDVCVVSPGFADTSEWVRAARAQCGVVISELELGWSRAGCRVIAVTGSNGKSTAVKWCAETLVRAGYKAVPAGNYGVSVCDAVSDHSDLDWLALEVSSFQLETVRDFRPEIGVVLNLHPNHLDRHKTLTAYADMKARLFARTRGGDWCFVPLALLEAMRTRSGGAGQWTTFGAQGTATYRAVEGRVYRGDMLIADLQGTLFGLPGMDATAAAVAGIMDVADVDARYLVESAHLFKPLLHRIQEIAVQDGVRYINDSKSTNLAAIEHALRALPEPVRLIAGGLAKESNFKRLKEVLVDRVQTVYLIGNSAEQMFSAWSCDVSCVICNTLDEALRQSRNDACAGEAILFSPGCASFDQFRNYEERGEHFTKRVLSLTGKGTS